MNKISMFILKYIIIHSTLSSDKIGEINSSISIQQEFHDYESVQNESDEYLSSYPKFQSRNEYCCMNQFNNLQQISIDQTDKKLYDASIYGTIPQKISFTNSSSCRKRMNDFEETHATKVKIFGTQELQNQSISKSESNVEISTTSTAILRNNSEEEVLPIQNKIMSFDRRQRENAKNKSQKISKIKAKETVKRQINEVHLPSDILANEIYSIFDSNFLTFVQHHSFENVFIYANFQKLSVILDKILEEDEKLLDQNNFTHYACNEDYFYEETFEHINFCAICPFFQNGIPNYGIQLSDEIQILVKILPARCAYLSSLVINEMKKIFDLFERSASYQILFSEEFIELHKNISKLKVRDEMQNLAKHNKFEMKFQLLHSQIHTFLYEHVGVKIIFFPEFASIAYLFHKRSIIDKIQHNNIFLTFYYSIVSINLFFNVVLKNNEIKTLIQNSANENNQIILQTISFLLRIYYIKPMITCFNLQIDTILRYSYLISKVFSNQVKSAANVCNDVKSHSFLLNCTTFALCLSTNISNLIFLRVSKGIGTSSGNAKFNWYNANDLQKFHTFLLGFNTIHKKSLSFLECAHL